MRRTVTGWALLAFAAAAAGAWFGRTVPVAQQWAIYNGLLTTSTIVFAVVGLWLALVYPEVMQALSQWRQQRNRQAQRITRLFEPLIESAFVVGTVALISLLYPIAIRLPLDPRVIEPIRGASFAAAAFLTVLQLRALYGAVSPLLEVGRRVLDEEEDARVRSGFPEPEPRLPADRPRASVP